MDSELRAQIVAVMQVEHEAAAVQDMLIDQVASVAERRLAVSVLQLLSDEQLEAMSTLEEQGATDEQVVNWLVRNVSNYSELVRSTVLDVAREAAKEE